MLDAYKESTAKGVHAANSDEAKRRKDVVDAVHKESVQDTKTSAKGKSTDDDSAYAEGWNIPIED